jgi:hypothetical protein
LKIGIWNFEKLLTFHAASKDLVVYPPPHKKNPPTEKNGKSPPHPHKNLPRRKCSSAENTPHGIPLPPHICNSFFSFKFLMSLFTFILKNNLFLFNCYQAQGMQ